jgi:CMP-N,N'-diacetyllegionaminic acid synthase
VRILALITARGGSKRIPGKNIRPLGGIPLIEWSIEICEGIPEICDVLVSTDDPSIGEVARGAGALVPWQRPAELASDTASSADVAVHALDWYEAHHGAVDGLLLLQPTSPFRRHDSVVRGIELFGAHERRSVVGVSPATPHPSWCVRVDGTEMRPFIRETGTELRSQDLPPAHFINGGFYLISPADLRARRSFFLDGCVPLVMNDREESLDIDTEWDWHLAEAILATRATDPK